MPDWGVRPDEAWSTEQLHRARASDSVANLVTRLLFVWWDNHKQPEDELQVLKYFTELAQNHAIEVPDEENKTMWVPVRPGQIKVADVVRVKPNAYSGEIGQRHNGRVGKVVAIRSGDIIVNTTDGEPRIEGTHHSPFALDKQVTVS